MLSYRHGYHAGNFADVLKHLVLIAVIDYFKKKEKPFCVFDTHAGSGLYEINSPWMQKNQEYLTGIDKIYRVKSNIDLIQRYQTIVQKYSSSDTMTHYPGSPNILKNLLRKQDTLHCFEYHSKEYSHLKAELIEDKVYLHCEDSYVYLKAYLPPHTKRGVVFIDPSYELKDEYQRVTEILLPAALKRFAWGTYLIWYPVIVRKETEQYIHALVSVCQGDMLRIEIKLKPDAINEGMTGCGMMIYHPPYILKNEFKKILPSLVNLLSAVGYHIQYYSPASKISQHR